MSAGSSNFDSHDEALEVVRQGLRKIEIETRRVKAHVARLEANLNDAAADELSGPEPSADSPSASRFDPPHDPPPIRPNRIDAATAEAAGPTNAGVPPQQKSTTVSAGSPHVVSYQNGAVTNSAALRTKPQYPVIPFGSNGSQLPNREKSPSKERSYRQSAPPIAISLIVHAIGLLLCLTFGFATLVQRQATLFASPAKLPDEAHEEFAEVEIETVKFDDAELQNVVSQTDEFNLADNLLYEVEAAELGAGSQPLGDIGQLDALPSDLGALMAGTGLPGRGRPGGDVGDAVFFGTRSVGNRFVFIVDNSSSMKGGRLEAAVAELLRTIDGLSPRQSFYVIFVSDQTYPMFYPQPAAALMPATGPNKRRLAEWLPNAVLASGKNRELIKAVDLAASLGPDAVYLLWDGDMRYSERVRMEVMTHLTRPQPWRFSIHTLGMGIMSLDAEYNLTSIAQAHGGTYRRVDVPKVPTRQ